MAHTISAASLVGTGSSAAAAAQVLSTVSTLTGDPDSISESSRRRAGLLNDVVGGARTGFDADTAAATAATVSSLLSASLFASGGGGTLEAANADLGGQMTGTGPLATGMIAGAYGGQNRSVVTENLERARLPDRLRDADAAFRSSSGPA